MAKQSYWPIIGHQSITTLLDHLLANPYLHNHAFLFCGQRHLGKTLVAEEFIKRLLKLADEVSIWQQPDVHLLERLPDKTEIGIEQVRVWQKDLILRPFAAPYKVGIIQEAEYLNQESSNALLKILEEPSGQTLIIIIVNDGQKILPTIRSRAQLVTFKPVPTEEITNGLLAAGSLPQLANEYAKKCNWRPGLAINWFNEPNLFQEQQNKEAVFKKLIQEADQANRSAFILNQDDYSTEGIRENISFLEASLAEIIRQGNWPINKILKIGESLRWGKTLLRQNVTPQVIWEYLIMSL